MYAIVKENAMVIIICANAARNRGLCMRRGIGGELSTFPFEDLELGPVAKDKKDSVLSKMLRKVATKGFMANGDDEQRTVTSRE